MLFLLFFAASSSTGFAQIDTTQYPQQRQEIRELLHKGGPGIEKSCGDLVAVGPKGDISFSRQEWIDAQKKEHLVFRALTVAPGSEVIRIYDGTTAVVNWLADVALTVEGKDISIKVRRLEVFHSVQGRWCMVAGQGTQVDETLFPVR